jgi:hypothetical protein
MKESSRHRDGGLGLWGEHWIPGEPKGENYIQIQSSIMHLTRLDSGVPASHCWRLWSATSGLRPARSLRRPLFFVTINLLLPLVALAAAAAPTAAAFEGRIQAVTTQGKETTPLLYTVGTNCLRIEVAVTNWPHAVNLVERSSDAMTLVFPHNRSFVRLKPAAENASAPSPGMPPMPVPAGVGPQSAPPPGAPAIPAPPAGLPTGIGPQAQSPGTPAMPAMPTMPMMRMPMEKMELKATGQKTNLLGYACERFELKQRGETLEVWATDRLLPFQPYQRDQPHRFSPPMLEEQWPGLLKARNLFPLRATLRFDNGAERYRFEVKSIQAGRIADRDGELFQPPPDYHEIEPLPS